MNDDKKTLSFWLVLICFILGVLETIFLSFGVDFIINIIVEGVAVLLSMLVYFGVLKGSDGKNIQETYEEIKKSLQNSLEETEDSQDDDDDDDDDDNDNDDDDEEDEDDDDNDDEEEKD